MNWCVIDKNGQVWDSVAEFRRNNGFVADTSLQSMDHLVRTLGCVVIDLTEHRCVLRANPSRMSGDAFVSATNLIQSAQVQPVAILWYGSDWHQEIYRSIKTARERLMSLMLHSVDTDLFHMRGRTIDSLPRDHQLVPLIEMWRANGGMINLARSSDVILKHTNTKYLAVRSDGSDGTLKFTDFGPGSYAIYDDLNWMKKCLGQRVEDQPDVKYGIWISGTYRHAMQINGPILKDMDTIVSDPRNGVTRRMQYVRLTLPVVGAGGERLLLSTSCRDPSIDLRVPIH